MSYLADLKAQLSLHEGYRDKPYKDTEGHLTIGVGHNLEKGLSQTVIDLILSEDIEEAESELDRVFDSWRKLSKNRRLVLVDMMFNMGAPTFMGFHRFWRAMMLKDYEDASIEMLDSNWATQVGDSPGQRANNLSLMMRDG